jgi:hypothetical protein
MAGSGALTRKRNWIFWIRNAGDVSMQIQKVSSVNISIRGTRVETKMPIDRMPPARSQMPHRIKCPLRVVPFCRTATIFALHAGDLQLWLNYHQWRMRDAGRGVRFPFTFQCRRSNTGWYVAGREGVLNVWPTVSCHQIWSAGDHKANIYNGSGRNGGSCTVAASKLLMRYPFADSQRGQSPTDTMEQTLVVVYAVLKQCFSFFVACKRINVNWAYIFSLYNYHTSE